MICVFCRKGADLVSHAVNMEDIKRARWMHTQCTDCDCQHKVDKQVLPDPSPVVNAVVE